MSARLGESFFVRTPATEQPKRTDQMHPHAELYADGELKSIIQTRPAYIHFGLSTPSVLQQEQKVPLQSQMNLAFDTEKEFIGKQRIF